jgi:xanthine dehydrogenase accessory factor
MDTLPDWPVYGLAADVRPVLAEAMAAGEPVALATLHAAFGGAPRPPGAQLRVGATRLSGFLSGGCVEGDVAAHARQVLATGEPARLIYGEGSPYPDIRLLCGARIDILVERILPDDPAARRLLDLTRERKPARWVTDGRARACLAEDETAPALREAVTRLYAPVPRLAVVGSDPTALAIAELASRMEFETTLIRPKGPQTPPALPGVAYMRQDADVALLAIGLDPWTHVAVATHDLLTDEAALACALPSQAAYVGVLGARRRIPERLSRLKSLGVPEAALARLKAPIGLDLGGKAPFEIAVAVMAEIVGEWSAREDHDRTQA